MSVHTMDRGIMMAQLSLCRTNSEVHVCTASRADCGFELQVNDEGQVHRTPQRLSPPALASGQHWPVNRNRSELPVRIEPSRASPLHLCEKL